MKHTDIIKSLSLEQKCALLSGGTVFTTRALPGKGIPAITLSDGPNGVRKQAGAADHLGLNPSVPATCFPTSATVANSWDPELGEAVGAAMGEEAAAQGRVGAAGPRPEHQAQPPCAAATSSISRRTPTLPVRWLRPTSAASRKTALPPVPSTLR